MSEHKPRPRALVAIVIHKCFMIGLFAINVAMFGYVLRHALEEPKKRMDQIGNKE